MSNYRSGPTLANVTFSGNLGSFGAGMYNYGASPTVTNTTFISNTAGNGGGIYNNTSNPTLTNLTFSGNSATNSGGAMYNYLGSSPTITNTILWGNTAPSGAQIYDYYPGSIVQVDHSVVQGGCPDFSSTCTNIITTDPRLGPLGYWGGATQTVPLLPGSSAIDAGNDAYCPPTDQRGVPRPQGAHCDIGAFEGQLMLLNLPLVSR